MKFKLALEAVENLYSVLEELSSNRKVINMLRSKSNLAGLVDFPMKELDPQVGILCILDVFRGFEFLGHTFDSHNDESKILSLLLFRISLPEQESLWGWEEGMFMMLGAGMADTCYHAYADNVQLTYVPKRLLLIDLLREDKMPDYLINKYVIALYRFLLIIATADNSLSESEKTWLAELVSFSTDEDLHEEAEKIVGEIPETPEPDLSDLREETEEKPEPEDKKKTEGASSKDGDSSKEEVSPLTRMQELIGLENVKKEVQNIFNLVRIQSLRLQKGLKLPNISYHCVFTGNPGTGKTTVARIIAEVYKELGILKKGHLVETDRSGLVAEYVGQTAVKTNKIIDSALDGVLFIDEAYTLAVNEAQDFGHEAIATLLKRMEDDRERLVVIIAGYSDEMKKFIEANPGLKSRFNRYIHFDDYNADELRQIFLSNLGKYDYSLTPQADRRLREVLDKAIETKDRHFGNGRYVRNLFEKTLENQARRLVEMTDLDGRTLSEIIPEDIPEQ